MAKGAPVVWLFVESVQPPRWGLRIGNWWTTARSVRITAPMVAQVRVGQPRMLLRARAWVGWHGEHATIRGAQ